MRSITSNIHGIFDYLFAIVLILMPWLMGVAPLGGPETLIPITIGVGIIAYSLLTEYEWGVFSIIPMRAHLIFDILAGLTLLFSAPFFGFYQYTHWWPYVVMGIVAILAGLMTLQDSQSSRPIFRAPRTWRSNVPA